MTSTLDPLQHDRPRTEVAGHGHPEPPWPLRPDDWDALSACHECGMGMLRVFIRSSTWVVRRVEKVTFLDDRTVRRQVSMDYALPDDAVALRRADGSITRIVPLTMMRRKSLVNFDLRDEEGRALPLLGLREAQALTLAVARAWARTTLRAREFSDGTLDPHVDRTIRFLMRGDQTEMKKAFAELWSHPTPAHAELHADEPFRGLMDRLAGGFIPFAMDHGEPGARRIVKFSYDEPLTLRYTTSAYRGYRGDGDARRDPTYDDTQERLPRFARAPRMAGLGIEPTLIRFPVPSAELAGSYHFEITAPPEVSIVEASLLAGLPKLYLDDDPKTDYDEWRKRYEQMKADTPGPDPQDAADAGERPRTLATGDERLRRRPSFDSVGGGYPTVDLHVVDVPYGSLCRAQVKLQANTAGWLSTAVTGAWMATGTLGVAFAAPFGDHTSELATVVLATFAAALVAALIRPDPHRMVTRLLSILRGAAALSALLTLLGAIVFAFFATRPEDWSDSPARWSLLGFCVLSLVPTLLVTWAFKSARSNASREARRPKDRQSPWEQFVPREGEPAPSGHDEPFHVTLAEALERAPYPYDHAVEALHFSQPAIKVASSEGSRVDFPWTQDFRATFFERLID